MDRTKPVLVVDDIQPVRETIINILKVLGYSNFLEADNGKDAIEAIEKNKDIQLIISDWKMPVINGLELLKWVRSNPDTEDLPFLFVTSKGEKEDIALAAEEKITDYIVKPIDIETFVEKLTNIEKRKEESLKTKNFLNELKNLFKEKKYEKAEEKINKFLETNRPKPNVLTEIAKLYLEIQPENALKTVDKVLKENPIYTEAWIVKADAYMILKNHKEALKSLKKAYEINPNSSKILFKIGKVCLALDELNKAKDYFLMALKCDPYNETLVQDIWNLYLKFDLVDRVLKDFEHILFERLSVKTLNNLAVALRKKGNIKEAIKAYRQALKREPENENLHYNISIAYLDFKRKDLAIQHLEKAVKIKPDFHNASELLEKLNKET